MKSYILLSKASSALYARQNYTTGAILCFSDYQLEIICFPADEILPSDFNIGDHHYIMIKKIAVARRKNFSHKIDRN